MSRYHRLSFGKKVLKLQWRALLCITVVMFFSSMTSVLPFPFLPKLVKSFGTSEVNAGFQVGVIGAQLFIGRFFSSLFWGYLADKTSCKKTGALTAVLTAIFTLAFGFTMNYEWAVVTRLFQGLTYGFTVIGKTLVMKFTDDSNRGIGMSLFIASYNTALIIGSSIGGFLAFPADKYPKVFKPDSLFSRFPILLPCGTVALSLAMSVILYLIFVPSTNRESKNLQGYDEGENSPMDSTSSEKTLSTLSTLDSKEGEFILKTSNVRKSWMYALMSEVKAYRETTFFRVLSGRSFRKLAFLFFVFSFICIGFEELFSIYAATAKEYNGYGFTTANIGTTLIIVAVTTVPFQLTLVPMVITEIGAKRGMMHGCILMSVSIPFVAVCNLIKNRYLFWATMITVNCIGRLAEENCFICLSLLINDSVESTLIGTANGLSLSAATLGRAISVPVIGAMYSWSLKNVQHGLYKNNALGFPFDEYFTFLLIGLMAMFCALYTYFLPTDRQTL